MSEDIDAALEQAGEHKYIGNSLFWMSWVFLTAAAFFAAARDWMPLVLAVAGMTVMGLLARREWEHEKQWAYCAEVWANEQADALWMGDGK